MDLGQGNSRKFLRDGDNVIISGKFLCMKTSGSSLQKNEIFIVFAL